MPETIEIFPIKRLDEISVTTYFYEPGKVPEGYSKSGDDVLANYISSL